MEQWNHLNQLEQIDALILESHTHPVLIFKDSTTCGISASVKHKVMSEFNQIANKVNFYYLDLLTYRPVSNVIAEKLDVIHQSPQIIVLKDGEVIHHSSHYAISIDKIAEAIER